MGGSVTSHCLEFTLWPTLKCGTTHLSDRLMKKKQQMKNKNKKQQQRQWPCLFCFCINAPRHTVAVKF